MTDWVPSAAIFDLRAAPDTLTRSRMALHHASRIDSRAPRVVAAVAAVSLLVFGGACESPPVRPGPAAGLREAHAWYPFPSASWAGVVPVALSTMADFVPTFVTAFALDGVAQPLPEQILIEICDGHAALRGPLDQVVGAVQVGADRLGRVVLGRCP
jgi:hypothetical protein